MTTAIQTQLKTLSVFVTVSLIIDKLKPACNTIARITPRIIDTDFTKAFL
jgi:hypothetical protein